jgi:hypothetical protein
LRRRSRAGLGQGRRTASDKCRPADYDRPPRDSLRTLHLIEDDLSEAWLVALTDSGVEAVDAHLAKYLPFLSCLEDDATSRRV